MYCMYNCLDLYMYYVEVWICRQMHSNQNEQLEGGGGGYLHRAKHKVALAEMYLRVVYGDS